jgi:Ca2+-transporting ATPase
VTTTARPQRLAGLSSEEATARLAEFGRNEVRVHQRVSTWSSVGGQLRDPLILVLLGAAILTIATGDWVDAAVIAVVVTANSAVGVVQEVRADRAVTSLSQLASPTVRVVRDRAEATVEAATVVPGDIVLLAEGDVVPADGIVREAVALMVDESALTGESAPAAKLGRHGEESGDVVYAGAVVVRGRAIVEVTGTGADSALGRIAALLDTRVEPTPLQRRLAALGRVLAVVAVVLSAVVLTVGLLRGEDAERMFIVAVSLAVAAVPESLPAVVTLSLALGARRMADRNAIVRRLSAVETLGSVTILATDKTGTLTEGRMTVVQAWTPQRSVTFTGRGYDPTGEILEDGIAITPGSAPDLTRLLIAATLCNDATLASGDPTEIALLVAAAKAGLGRSALEQRYPRVDEVPFDSATQKMTTIHATTNGYWAITKGSPEVVSPDHTILRRAAALAAQGYRVLAVSETESAAPSLSSPVSAPARFLGLLAIADPPKAEAAPTIAACREAGITPVLITGDHPATARAIAREVGIIGQSDGTVVTGDEIRPERIACPTAPRVFARTTPEHKLDIIRAWRASGEAVAMTGDGVNDGPALRQSDIGVAMGRRGTEVARQAADLILADDHLATVVAAVHEGRRVYANIRRFLVFGLAGGAAAIIVMLAGPAVGLSVPLLASQILWINLLTHGLTGVALGAEPADPGAMQRPPRPPDQSVLGDGLWQRVVRLAIIIAGLALALAVWANHTDREWQTMLFLGLTSLELGVAIGLRARTWTVDNPFLPVAVAGSLLLALAGVYVPWLRDLLGTAWLPPGDAVLAALTGVVGWAVTRSDRAVFRERRRMREGGLRRGAGYGYRDVRHKSVRRGSLSEVNVNLNESPVLEDVDLLE